VIAAGRLQAEGTPAELKARVDGSDREPTLEDAYVDVVMQAVPA
jgi:hypothetical protein